MCIPNVVTIKVFGKENDTGTSSIFEIIYMEQKSELME